MTPLPTNRHPHARRHRARRGGFTLLEAALATVIVGTGVLAIVAAQQAYHMKNAWAQRTSTAQLLANEVRELTLTLPMHDPLTGKSNFGPESNENSIADYDDLDDFAGPIGATGEHEGMVFSPPVNALRQEVGDLEGWRQVVTVVNVLPENISASYGQPLGTTSMMRVTVAVQYQSPQETEPETVTELTWVVGD